MKRMKLLSLGLVLSLMVAVGAAGTTLAAWSPNFQSSDAVTLAKDKTHEGSLYAAGGDITVDGTVNGSVYCAGNVVTINGTVNGDVLCAGQKVTVNGSVSGDVRTAGQFVEMNGTVGGSLSALAQDVRLSKDANVAGDVNGAAQQFTLNGTTGRDVAIGTQLLTLNGEVKGNVDVATEQIRLGGQASVLGNLNYSAPRELSLNTSSVKGQVSFNPQETNGRQYSSGRFFAAIKVMFILMFAVSALLMVLVMPRFVNRSSELFQRRMLMTVLLGFAFVFGGPIIVGFLLFSVILAPFGLALLFAWLAILLLSTPFFAYWIGAELLRSQPNAIVRMLGGIAILTVAFILPYIGGLLLFISLVTGAGMIVATLTNGYRRPQYQIAAPKKAAAK